MNDLQHTQNQGMQKPIGEDRQKLGLIALVVGFFFGGWGIHRFLMGDTKGGIIRCVLNLACGIGALITMIEGILYLLKSDEDFHQQYIVEKKAWF